MHQQPRKILYIDDDPGTRRLVQKLLERRGHTVVQAADGNEGVKLAAEGGFEDPEATALLALLSGR